MFSTIGSFVFITTLVLFAVANSESRPQRRVCQTPQSDVSQALFKRTSACMRARKTHSKRKQTLNRRTPGSQPVVTLPLEKQGALLVGKAEIGTPLYLTCPQIFDLSVDTSFPYIWVAQRGIHSGLPHEYEPHFSASMDMTKISFQYRGMSGRVYLDDLDIAGVKFNQTAIIGATTIPTRRPEHADGVFGLSPADFAWKMLPLFSVAITRKEISSTIFALRHLEDSQWQLHLGGIDPDLVTGGIEYHPIIRRNPHYAIQWIIDHGRILVNGQDKKHIFWTIIASASGFIEGDPDVVNAIYKEIYPEHKNGQYQFPCDNVPQVSFRWSNMKAWEIAKEDFIYTRLGGGMCEGVLRSLDNGGPWILGNVFMKYKYIIFYPDVGIGFVDLKPKRPGQPKPTR